MNCNIFGITYTKEEEQRIKDAMQIAAAFFKTFGKAPEQVPWWWRAEQTDDAPEKLTGIEIEERYGISESRLRNAKQNGLIAPVDRGYKGAFLYRKEDVVQLRKYLNEQDSIHYTHYRK